ncbi:MAG: YcnI family protein [Microlunatus sp.]
MNALPARHSWRRRGTLVAAALATMSLTLLPITADAHVRVVSDNANSGGYSALTFRVPNESATAGTVKLTVDLPTDHPFLYVSTKPVPGWTATTKKSKLPKPVDSHGTTVTEAISSVTWTADKGNQIKPGEYQEFSISVGPLPDPGTVLLPATQTYSDGEVVTWDEPTPASGEEPEHPAPQLEVVAGDADHHGAAAQSPAGPAAESQAQQTSDAQGLTRTLGGLGLMMGFVAFVVSALAWRRSGRGTSA